ncbi:MAG TPA: hypothetical protein VK831_00450 [Candidatus Deferrimicrobiaceae bacterium]|nr:hypothetical protein [Candidatus Deferrimicrobiaceae bacterium]
MQRVTVRILHPAPNSVAGALSRALAAACAANAGRLARLFDAAGADDVAIVEGQPDGRSFGGRLRDLVADLPVAADGGRGGLVVLGSGALPLATRSYVARLIAVARSGERRALANSFYSADAVAIGRATDLQNVPALSTDNALPRWLREVAGYVIEDDGRRWRLAVDLDSPLDVVLVDERAVADLPATAIRERLQRIRAVAADPTAELVIAGRTNAATLRWLERWTASRTRALVEERGLRSIGLAEQVRGPRSTLGLVLDDRGPQALGTILAELGDAAIVDTRVLLAHRLGADERTWPAAEDRFASDLLLPDLVGDPWLRDLTASALEATIPTLLGGHTLVGPGVRLALRGER